MFQLIINDKIRSVFWSHSADTMLLYYDDGTVASK